LAVTTIVVLAALALLAPLAGAAGSATTPNGSSPVAGAESLRGEEIEALQDEVDHLDSLWGFLLLPMSILVALLAGGGAIGFVTSLRYERRSQERAAEIHAITVSGESASQERAAESHLKFLADSHETLTLVNDTLALAKQASERAEEAIQEKASERLKDIDRDAREVLAEALDTGEFKAVVREPVIEERLKDVAYRVGRIEGLAGAHGLGLTPHCLFAEGLDRHMHSVPQRAIESWEEAAKEADDSELSALALYWVGYERNNVGEFNRAAKAFREARETHLPDKERSQHYELNRIEVQTRFFEAARQTSAISDRRRIVQEFIDDLDELIGSLTAVNRMNFDRERRHCEETIGDLLLWSARLSPLERRHSEPFSDVEQVSLGEAMIRFERAGDLVWARFGSAQIKWALHDELEEQDYRDLLETLMGEAGSHREPRTLALRHSAILIAEGEHHDAKEALDRAYRDLWSDVHYIGGRLTVFSPWQKRNVTLDQFKEEVSAYWHQCRNGR
jgi:tetratricopeptide (TPR) repeat protein